MDQSGGGHSSSAWNWANLMAFKVLAIPCLNLSSLCSLATVAWHVNSSSVEAPAAEY